MFVDIALSENVYDRLSRFSRFFTTNMLPTKKSIVFWIAVVKEFSENLRAAAPAADPGIND